MLVVPTASGQSPLSRVTTCWMSSMARSTFTVSSKVRYTTDTLSEETEVTCLRSSRAARFCSRGLVTVVSTSSGAAPT